MTDVKAKVNGARVLVREKTSAVGKKTRVVRVTEGFVSMDKLGISAEGVTAKGNNCTLATDTTELPVKRLRIIAQSIIIQPL